MVKQDSNTSQAFRTTARFGVSLIIMAAIMYLLAPPIQANGPNAGSLESGLAHDMFIAPPMADVPSGLEAQTNTPLPGYGQTSEFMIGSVAVGVILPESNGSEDPSTENWTKTEQAQILEEIKTALDWWAVREPNAHLTFILDEDPLPTTATGFEPVTHPQTEQGLWIADVMATKGHPFTISYFDQVRQYNDMLREAHHTDWAFTIFVVDSSDDSDGRFAEGSNSLFAYAYVNGPFMIVTSTSASYGISNLDAVITHEIGHIFGALDQYATASIPCTWQAGYLGSENQNSQCEGCLSDVSSIMRGGISPFLTGAIDEYARAQVGWADSDGDGILNPLDTPINIVDQVNPEASSDEETFSYSGQVQQSTVPSPLRDSVLINPINQIQYKVGAAPWTNTRPADGEFDSPTEGFSFTTPPLPGGEVKIEIRVLDEFGSQLSTYNAATLIRPGGESPQMNHQLFLPALAR